METLVGFAVGFFFGTREGRQGLDRIKASWAAIRDSTDVQHFVGEAAATVVPIVRDLARARA